MYPGRGTCVRGWERERTQVRRELKAQDVLSTGSRMVGGGQENRFREVKACTITAISLSVM